ncbi:ferredoxin domain-containing protein [Methanococcoides methylutens]|uniref:ferredoxin domain-containing protein n=1 Tax=Methanococcoides methylutens TaxID=2226 RepID=UPI004044ED7A
MKLNPESETIEMLAKTILVAARTAPKAKGKDDIVTALLEPEDMEVLASSMEEMADRKGEGFAFFKRDAQNVRNADAVILIGFKTEGVAGLNCGACGFENCKDMLQQSKVNVDFTGPNCSFKFIDMGIALGSAAARAKDLCVDNRVMYSVGAGALSAGLLDANIACGMPLSIKGKNMFFDRK